MNEIWNLDPMYKGFEDPAFEADLNLAKEKMDALEALVGRLTTMEPAKGLLEGICLQEELADLLGGVVACTRPLVENNTMDAKHQIGLSGRTVKPKLIFTLGISGAVQFAAGMKSSDCIVAINTDPAAPIFDIAHYCVVGDVNLIVPKLISMIKGVS